MSLEQDYAYRTFVEGRLLGLRNNRYSWWTHWRELADNFLPRRYRWLITPNMQNRGSPINQHIIDSSGVIAARNLAAGLMSGKTSPTRPWFKLKIGQMDDTLTNPVSLWLAEVKRRMQIVMHVSNFYSAMARFYFDLVIFGTAALLIYEDFDTIVNCINPCLGEYYVDINGQYRPVIFYREYTYTVQQVVDEFGIENVSQSVLALYNQQSGVGRTREIIVAHAIEPNDGKFGIPSIFAFRECYWEWGGSTNPQAGAPNSPRFLRKQGYYEQMHAVGRWDVTSNDPYGRGPAMDALGDQKQLQLQTRRKAQAIDKMVNPPLVADIQMKNQPASLLPGAMNYIAGYSQTGKAGIGSVYDTKFPVGELSEDMKEVQERLRKIFFNDLFQPLSQYETRSNITAVEIDQRKSEALIMLGPVFTLLDTDVLPVVIDRIFAVMARARLLPPPPQEIVNQPIDVSFVSMLNTVQDSLEAAAIERLFSLSGNLAGVKPDIMDNLDTDFGLDKYGNLLQVDPRIIRSPEATAQIRQQRAQQEQAAMQAELADKYAASAKNLAAADVGSRNALTALMGTEPTGA